MMQKKCYLSIFLGILTTFSFSQEFVWQADVNSFFNNLEFGGSALKNSQTMTGVHFVPQIGLSYQDNHRIYVGFDAMHEFGSQKTVEYRFPIAYYQFDGKPFSFYMGAFPRKKLIDSYPRMFFQDSINNYRPVINGLFWEIRSQRDDFFNVWLDWTGRQSYEQREAFFVGWSGRHNYGKFYGQQFGYMFHYASSTNPAILEPVQDNALILTSLGINLSEQTKLEKLDVNIGWSVGLDRDRGSHQGWYIAHGFLSEITAQYRSVGLFNTFYHGQRQQPQYNLYQNRLYWGDPTYRAPTYNRTDIYAYFIKNEVVSVKFIYSLHFLEKKIYHEQSLYVVFGVR